MLAPLWKEMCKKLSASKFSFTGGETTPRDQQSRPLDLCPDSLRVIVVIVYLDLFLLKGVMLMWASIYLLHTSYYHGEHGLIGPHHNL